MTLYDQAETVTIVLNTPECYGIEGVWSLTAAGKTNSIALTDLDSKFEIKANEDMLDVKTGKVMWTDLTFDGPYSGDILTATYEIPAGTPNGNYTITFTRDVFTGEDFEPIDTNVVYTATIKVTNHVCNDDKADNDHLCDDPKCGKQVGDHSYGTKWESDEELHWKECACGETTTPAPHDFTNGDCVCGAKSPITLGDLDLDGDVDSADLTLLARHVGRIEYLTGNALANADVDSDGDISSNDLTMHARYIAGIITEWP